MVPPARELQHARKPGVVSRDAANVADILLRAPAASRRHAFKHDITTRERPHVMREVERATGSMYGLWHDTPSGFIEDVLGESIWSRQREIVDAVPFHKRIAVPAGFGVGKTWIAGRLVAWAGAVNAPGTMVIVTTATRFRQVRNQLWPHIRKTVARAGLPGYCDTTQWKIPDQWGNDVIVAYGFTAPENDEAAMQGIHGTPKLLIVVDEAGGIARMIGNGTNNLLTGDARMLAIGNPAMDDPRSWFEGLCEEGEDPEEPSTVTIPIATFASPAITKERVPYCNDCPDGVPPHSLAIHLPDQEWVDRTIREYGPDHPYVIAKVHAKFPKGGGGLTIPVTWVEAAQTSDDPTGPGWRRLCDLGIEKETATHTVKDGAWVRLGVDVAADGGDEFVISRIVGDVIETRYCSSGTINDDQVLLAEKVLEEIKAAQLVADAIGSPHPVRVKVDQNGIGHGVVSMLKRWADTGRHQAQIVGVMVSESPEQDDPGAQMRPYRKRDEMWLATRGLLQPDPSTGLGRLRLRVDRQTGIQLSTPRLGSNSAGYSVVESKKAMKQRGMKSPDRADAALLTVYEPEPINPPRRRGLLN
ncbi:terminase large subunit [Streptomyces phage Gilgamesh]|uniref:Terminase large subunit n=1 Tax=Streptomyces phage Gilgamesh TaxID=2599890 RepID=A0A5J6TQW4_9CAUD|nr:terminase large subunit [Streptomyces phage Gilgamesh]QFG13193.1 terminase large subunit [Streptomyces phage Gilgamesh]